MTALFTLPLAVPSCRPNTRELLPLDQYDLCLVSFSGGKDSLSLVLDLLDRRVSRDRIQLWHQDVDGELRPGPAVHGLALHARLRQGRWPGSGHSHSLPVQAWRL